MAATVVDICNLALARLGDRANVVSLDPPEGSAQADHCARFYPVARDAALEAHDWSFASTKDTMAELSVEDFKWRHVFALPNNCIALRAVGYQDSALYAFDERGPYFERGALADGTQVLYTNEPTPFARFTRRVVDPTRYNVLFTQALVTLLAAYLAGPVIKGRSGAQMGQVLMQDFMAQVGRAVASDANQSNYKPPYRSSNMVRRGVNLAGGRLAAAAELPFWAV